MGSHGLLFCIQETRFDRGTKSDQTLHDKHAALSHRRPLNRWQWFRLGHFRLPCKPPLDSLDLLVICLVGWLVGGLLAGLLAWCYTLSSARWIQLWLFIPFRRRHPCGLHACGPAPSLRRAPRPALRGNQAKRRAKPRPGHGKPGKGSTFCSGEKPEESQKLGVWPLCLDQRKGHPQKATALFWRYPLYPFAVVKTPERWIEI